LEASCLLDLLLPFEPFSQRQSLNVKIVARAKIPARIRGVLVADKQYARDGLRKALGGTLLKQMG